MESINNISVCFLYYIEQYKSLWPAVLTNQLIRKMVILCWLHPIIFTGSISSWLSSLLENFLIALLEYLSTSVHDCSTSVSIILQKQSKRVLLRF